MMQLPCTQLPYARKQLLHAHPQPDFEGGKMTLGRTGFCGHPARGIP